MIGTSRRQITSEKLTLEQVPLRGTSSNFNFSNEIRVVRVVAQALTYRVVVISSSCDLRPRFRQKKMTLEMVLLRRTNSNINFFWRKLQKTLKKKNEKKIFFQKFIFNLKKKYIFSEIKHYSKNKDKKKSDGNLRSYGGWAKCAFVGEGALWSLKSDRDQTHFRYTPHNSLSCRPIFFLDPYS